MTAISTGLIGLSKPLLLVALIVVAVGALAIERIWTRSRRRRRLEPGAFAYLLDGLVILSLVVMLFSAISMFVDGLTSMAVMVGGVIDGERIGLLIVGMALALGIALVLARATSGRRTAATAGVPLPISPMSPVAEVRLAEPQSVYAAAPERFEVQPLAMMQERWQPGAVSAASVPTSFLDLAEPRAKKPERSRFALASTLLVLAVMVMLVSSAFLFRHQLINVLAGMEASYGGAVAAGPGASPSQPDTNSAAANVSAAAPAASAPTAATMPAQPPENAAEGVQRRVKSNGLNMRALPGVDQSVVAVLRQGDAVTVFTDARLIQGATWVKIRAGDTEGWVDQSLLE